jgi:hypothetical protein
VRGDHAQLGQLRPRHLGDHLIGLAGRLIPAHRLGAELLFEEVGQARRPQRSSIRDRRRVSQGNKAIAGLFQFPKAVRDIGVGRQGSQTLTEFGDISLADRNVMDAAQHPEHAGSKLTKGAKALVRVADSE